MEYTIANESCDSPMVDSEESVEGFASWQGIFDIDKELNKWMLDDIVNISFCSVEEAELFYHGYARMAGFSIRRDKISVDGDIIKMRKWLCSRAGFRRTTANAEHDIPSRRPRYDSRCGCRASFKVRLSPAQEVYYPVQFNSEHNHECLPSDYSRHLRSHRNVDSASAHQISELRAAGVKPAQIMNVFVNQSGGYDSVGFSRKDLYNYVYRTASARDISTEFELALLYIKELVSTDPGICCRVHCDDDGIVSRVFYSDTISRADFDAFGDVVLCDATYKTNRLRLPLVLLLGVDNHLKTIIYGCALVADETKETYKWVFETFVSCMGKHPCVIITDRDRAIRWGIQQVMPHTRHRLFTWHIIRNLSGVCRNRLLEYELDKLMNKRYCQTVFKERWHNMLIQFGLDKGDRRWVNDLSASITLWAESYFTSLFTAGLRTNQRAEATNSSLKNFVDVSLSVANFFHKYIAFLDSLREETMRLECINSQSRPANLCRVFKSIRTQVANLYTLAVYEKVHEEMMKSEYYNCDPASLVSDGTKRQFRVHKYDANPFDDKSIIVTCDRRDFYLKCVCGMMESEGLPCKHMFAVIKQFGISQLADRNLRQRWMKTARDMCSLSSSASQAINVTVNRPSIVHPQCKVMPYVPYLDGDRMDAAMQENEETHERHRYQFMVNDNVTVDRIRMAGNVPRLPIFRDPPIVRTKGAPKLKPATTTRTCSYCLEPGHTKRTYAIREQDIAITSGNVESYNTVTRG